MNSNERSALDRAMKIIGNQSVIADYIGVSRQAVSLWKENGIPANRIIPICRLTNWKVRPHELNNALYPDKKWLPLSANGQREQRGHDT